MNHPTPCLINSVLTLSRLLPECRGSVSLTLPRGPR